MVVEKKSCLVWVLVADEGQHCRPLALASTTYFFVGPSKLSAGQRQQRAG